MNTKRWHFIIISNDDNSIYSDSGNIVKNNGYGEEIDFEGYETESLAKFWAKDIMKLYLLKEKDYTINTYSKLYRLVVADN